MTIKVKQNLVPPYKYSIKCPYSMDAQFITRHDTYNDATAANEIAYMIRNNNQVSYHFAIDENEVIQGIPVNRNAWACGDGGNGTGNRKSISVEVCYSKSGGVKYERANKLANKFIAQLLHDRGWGVERVKPHQFWSGKFCPHRILADKRWNEIISDIQKELDLLNGKKVTTPVSQPKTIPTVSKGYLSYGDKGDKVKNLQTLLNKAGANPTLVVDGSFGSATLKAVKDFQRNNRLVVDGFAGNMTMQVLEAYTAPRQEIKVRSYLKKGDKGNDVKEMQTLLKKFGFYKGAIDGSFGSQTHSALLSFQKAAGIKVDGYYGSQSQKTLADYNPKKPSIDLPTVVLRYGSKGEQVKKLQRALNALNFKCGAVDGSFGKATLDAVKRFQSVYTPYEIDGSVGPKTLKVMREQLSK